MKIKTKRNMVRVGDGAQRILEFLILVNILIIGLYAVTPEFPIYYAGLAYESTIVNLMIAVVFIGQFIVGTYAIVTNNIRLRMAMLLVMMGSFLFVTITMVQSIGVWHPEWGSMVTAVLATLVLRLNMWAKYGD